MLRLWYKAKSIYSLYKAGNTPPTKRSAAQFPRVKAPPVWAGPSEIMGAFVLALRCAAAAVCVGLQMSMLSSLRSAAITTLWRRLLILQGMKGDGHDVTSQLTNLLPTGNRIALPPLVVFPPPVRNIENIAHHSSRFILCCSNMKSNATVPAFLTKLWTLVEDEDSDGLIRWSQVTSVPSAVRSRRTPPQTPPC